MTITGRRHAHGGGVEPGRRPSAAPGQVRSHGGAREIDDFDLRHIRYFLTVARMGTVSAAAEELRISQPSLSQQIRRLEERVGAPLFTRTPRGVELTLGGQAFLREVQSIPGQLRTAIAAATPPTAEWGVGVCAGAPGRLLACIQRELTRSVDGERVAAQLRLHAVPAVQQAPMMDTGSLAFGLRPPAAGVQLAQATVWDEPLGLVLGAGHPLAALDRPQWSDLAKQRLLWYEAGCAPGHAEIVPAQLAALGWSPQLHRVDADQQALFVHALRSTGELVALRSMAAAEDLPHLVWRPLPTSRPPRERLALTALAGSLQARVLLHHARRLGWPVLH
jgi:DNA-binding transcriptional LysR family regulator